MSSDFFWDLITGFRFRRGQGGHILNEKADKGAVGKVAYKFPEEHVCDNLTAIDSGRAIHYYCSVCNTFQGSRRR